MTMTWREMLTTVLAESESMISKALWNIITLQQSMVKARAQQIFVAYRNTAGLIKARNTNNNNINSVNIFYIRLWQFNHSPCSKYQLLREEFRVSLIFKAETLDLCVLIKSIHSCRVNDVKFSQHILCNVFTILYTVRSSHIERSILLATCKMQINYKIIKLFENWPVVLLRKLTLLQFSQN